MLMKELCLITVLLNENTQYECKNSLGSGKNKDYTLH